MQKKRLLNWKRKKAKLRNEDIKMITDTYHSWRNKKGGYEDVSGFCMSATMEEIGSFAIWFACNFTNTANVISTFGLQKFHFSH